MSFKYLNLKKTRQQIVSFKKEPEVLHGRRNFMKTIGLGAISIGPFFHSFRSVVSQPTCFSFRNNKLLFYRNGKVAWEVSDKYFEPGYSIYFEQKSRHCIISASNLKIKGTEPIFSMHSTVFNQDKSWDFNFIIPEFGFKAEGNFLLWADQIKPLSDTINIEKEIIKLNSEDKVSLSGKLIFTLSPNWEMAFDSNNAIQFFSDGKKYAANRMIIKPGIFNTENNIDLRVHASTIISLPGFANWKQFAENLDFDNGKLKTYEGLNPDIRIGIPYSNSLNNRYYSISSRNESIQYLPGAFSDEGIELKNYFLYAEYLNNQPAKTYFAATLPVAGQWISNKLGAFRIENDKKTPVFEAFGIGNRFDEVLLEPRLRAFKPHVEDGTVMGYWDQDPQKVRVIQQQKATNRTTAPPPTGTLNQQNQNQQNTGQEQQRQQTNQNRQRQIVIPDNTLKRQQEQQQKEDERQQEQDRQQKERESARQRQQGTTIRDPQRNQPKIEIDSENFRFSPKKAVNIRILRPEDLLVLDLEFHNFNFTNKGQSYFLEPDNKKESGIMIVWFQSQHTLEEAYYEATPIPDNDPEKPKEGEISLPAKFLRARKSRLVYELPAGHEGFPLNLSELLDWRKFTLRVHPRAWIKLPSISNIRIPEKFTLGRQSRIPENKNLKYLNSPLTEYGLKLAQNNKVRVSNLQVYDNAQIIKTLPAQRAATVGPAFSLQGIKLNDMSVAPIPDLSTSIEAPALMFISPNQVNDFFHKTEISFRSISEQTNRQVMDNKSNTSTNIVLNAPLRVYDPLSTSQGEVTELWHTRLGVKLKNGKTTVGTLKNLKTIRALWADEATKEYVAKERNFPFMASLDANNRQKLVHTTSNYSLGFDPFPVPVNDLMLTPLGAYLDWHAFFDVPTPQDNDLNIIEWEHIATLGRDHFVKIVEEGYLFPFGHRAAVVKITERKFHQQTKAALLRQRMFIVVLEKEVLYTRNDPDGRFIEFPFQAIRLETTKTPNIDNPADSTLVSVPVSTAGRYNFARKISGGANTTYNFYINVGKKGFPFDIVGTDKEGGEHVFRMPLVFLENSIARDKNLVEKVIKVYQGDNGNQSNKMYNEAGFSGQDVAYTESLLEGDTSFETETIKFDAQIYPAKNEGDIKFHPKLKNAWVYIKQINEMTGKRDLTTISLEDDSNKGGVFARVVSESVIDFSGGSDKSGGFLTPNVAISGLSKLQGPVSGKLEDLMDLKFIPTDFFKALEDLPAAKIFGVIDIFALLLGTSAKPLNLSGSFDSLIKTITAVREEIEALKNEIRYLEQQALETKENLENKITEIQNKIKDKVNEMITALNNSIPRIPNLKSWFTEEAYNAEYKWIPELGGSSMEIIPSLLKVGVNNPKTALSITTKFTKPFDSTKPAVLSGLARFEKFKVDIVPLMVVNFDFLEFRSGTSQKTDVKVEMDKKEPIKFQGVLNFVNNLQSVIPSGGFSEDGPYIELSPTQVKAGFDLSIPNVEVGICNITNMSLGAAVTLPFTGAPLTLSFNFCTRENPFLLTVSIYGGGGYFMMVTTLKGIQSIEAAFEFGAAVSLNVGVASGGVSVMGGFYFKLELVDGDEMITLTGYLRINGRLSILGIITVSLEFYLALTAVIYQGKVQKMEGEATLKVKVEVLFFSKTVKVSVRKELKGADADPKFTEMVEPDDWQEYCLAFAG